MTLEKNAFENIEKKGGNVGAQYFFPFPLMFSVYLWTNSIIWKTLEMSTVNSLNIREFKSLPCGTGLKVQGPYPTTILKNIPCLFITICKFECNTTSDWLNRSCVTFKCF